MNPNNGKTPGVSGWAHGVLVAMFTLVPITVTPWSFDQFELPKEFVFNLGLQIFILLGLMEILRGRKVSRVSIWNAWLLLFAAGVVVSWSLSPLRYMGFRATLTILLTIVALWLLSIQITSRLLGRCLWATMAGGWINSLFAVLQFFNLDPIFINAAGGEEIYGRHFTGGFLGNPNLLGIFLAHTIIGAVILVIWKWRVPFQRNLALFSAIIFGAVFFLVQALAALIALAGTAVVGLAIAYPFIRISWRHVLKFGVPVLVVALVISIWIFGLDPYNTNRVTNVFRGIQNADWELATHGRFHTARVAWSMITDRPWMGHGPGTFSFLYFGYRIKLYPGTTDEIANPGQYAVQAHNEFLQGAVELGWPGMLWVMAGLIALSLRSWDRMVKVLPDLKTLTEDPKPPPKNQERKQKNSNCHENLARLEWLGAAWGILVLVCTLINALANFTLHTPHSALPTILAVGYLLGFVQGSLKPTQDIPESLGKSRGWVIVPLVLLMVGGTVPAARVYWASCLERSTFRYLENWQRSIQGQAGSPIPDKILEDLEKAARIDPTNFHVTQMLGAVHLLRREPEEARTALAKSLEYRRDPETLLNYGIALAELRRSDEAIDAFRQGLLYLPGHEKLRNALSWVEQQQSKWVFLPVVHF